MSQFDLTLLECYAMSGVFNVTLVFSESEWNDCCNHQPGLYCDLSQPSDRGNLLLHHCPLHAPRLLRHLLCSSSQCESDPVRPRPGN